MTPRNHIDRRICKALIESLSLDIEEDDLRYSENLDDVIGLDSLAVLEFVAALEKEFNVTLAEDRVDLNLLRDLPALAEYIQTLTEPTPQ
jgi:acyl carrier protein